MSVLSPTRHWSLGRPVLVVAGVVFAAVLDSAALGSGRSSGGLYLWHGLVVAVPVALLLVYVAGRRPYCAALGLAGLIAFNAALVARAATAPSPEPLLVAVTVVLAAGTALVRLGRARQLDVVVGLLMAYVGAAFLFEVGAVL
jgi:hypothetical protein